MFKKNNKQVELQSSESDVSNESDENPCQPLRKTIHEGEDDDYSQSEQEMSDNEADGDLRTNFSKHPTSMAVNQSSSDQESEEEDSLDDNQYFRTKEIKNGIHTIREDPKESLEDDSIDFIQQRIKKLEQDLETRLNKHKDKGPEEKNHGKIVNKVRPPPMPQKKPNNQETENKMSSINQLPNKIQVEKKAEIKKVIQTAPISTIAPAAKEKEKKAKKDENPQIKESRAQSKHSQPSQQSHPAKKSKPKKQEPPKDDQKTHQFFNDNSAQLQQKINEMAKAMKELKLENQVLKQKLESEKTKKEKSKSKTVEELQRLRQVADSSTTSKLQKEIELLDVIEKLQVKLKKSISRKLAKQGNAAASLLHKGLPTTIQSNF